MLFRSVKVQQKYHWRNFDDIKVTEPVSQKKLAWSDFMTAFAGSFDGALVDLQEQKLDKARQNFAAFTDQYHAMATEGCVQCHVDRAGNAIPRHYYVDEGSAALVEQMGQALAADPPDVNAVMGLSGAVGMDICMNCHLVHMPAQTTKDIWSTYAKVIK